MISLSRLVWVVPSLTFDYSVGGLTAVSPQLVINADGCDIVTAMVGFVLMISASSLHFLNRILHDYSSSPLRMSALPDGRSTHKWMGFVEGLTVV